MNIRVGCCGWCIKGGKREYCKVFETVEIQETFYKLPRVETVKKWREETYSEFIFNMKAWQAVTHPPTSPTWRRSGVRIARSKISKYGFLKPTEENFEAWEKTLEVADAMNARVVVVQTPASFSYSRDNLENIEEFFSTAKRGSSNIGWEPRGDWREHLDEIRRICIKHDILHITDPFRCENVSIHNVRYYRLHGIGGKEVNYSYKYTVSDFKKLVEIISRDKDEGVEDVYVMFNNISMRDDALNFKNFVLSYF
ncbi:MAG: DUF72 domain-containing protein [Thaumarchaeota archaeon]|jgi:uncharacterized protein YecE (DUF72 family)|nr:DUF72 domain-containing protein [Candidatus Geocrenenecus arthurdayi]